MIKKDSLKKLHHTTVIEKAKPALEAKGYKFVKTKLEFYKTEGEFKQTISLWNRDIKIEYDREKNEISLYFSIYSSIQLPKFDKWQKKRNLNHLRFQHGVNRYQCYCRIEDDDLEVLQYYTPTASQKFKAYVSARISGSFQRTIYHLDFEELHRLKYQPLTGNLEVFSDFSRIFEARGKNHEFDLTYLNLMIYADDREKVKDIFIQKTEIQRAHLQNAETKNLAEKKAAIDQFNALVKTVNEDFETNLPLMSDDFELYKMSPGNSVFQLTEGLFLKEKFSIEKPLYGISNFVKTKNALIQVQGNGNLIYHDWEGKELRRVKLSGGNKLQPYDQLTAPGVNKYIEETDSFFTQNFIIDSEGVVHELELKINKAFKKENLRVAFSPCYLPKRKQYCFLLSDFKSHEIHFFNLDYQLEKIIEIDHLPVEIVPELEIIIAYVDMKSVEIYDLDGNHLRSLTSNNARLSYRTYYDLSVKADLLITFCYYVKSQSFRLSTGESLKPLWAHQTYLKGYKEQFYNDIHHNFGMTKAKISPNGDYIIGCADHGKYVAWEVKGFKRFELIPNEDFLPKIPPAEIVELDGNRMLKNRGNHIWSIVFFENGEYFGTQIKKYLLIWNRRFEHIQTIEVANKIRSIGGNYFMIGSEVEVSIFELKRKKS